MAAYTGIAATTAAVANRIVTSTNMKVGAYVVANASPVWQGGAFITVTHTAVGAVDTLGTITVAGTDTAGNTRSESITPLNGTVATGTIAFRTVTAVTGVGWVINEGNDTIVVGVAAGSIVCGSGGTLYAIVVNTTAAAAITVSDSVGTIATLKTSIAEGHYIYGPGVDFTGYLKVATTAANNITVIASPTKGWG